MDFLHLLHVRNLRNRPHLPASSTNAPRVPPTLNVNPISAGTDVVSTEKSGAPKHVASNDFAIFALRIVTASLLNVTLPSASILTGAERISANFQNVPHVLRRPRVCPVSVRITSARMELFVDLSNVSFEHPPHPRSCRPSSTNLLRLLPLPPHRKPGRRYPPRHRYRPPLLQCRRWNL